MASKPRAIWQPEPQLPDDAPMWAHQIVQDLMEQIRTLKERLIEVEARIDAASIPE